jgi:hypothetical protein
VQLERLDDAASGHIAPDAAITVGYEVGPQHSTNVDLPSRTNVYHSRAPPIS